MASKDVINNLYEIIYKLQDNQKALEARVSELENKNIITKSDPLTSSGIKDSKHFIKINNIPLEQWKNHLSICSFNIEYLFQNDFIKMIVKILTDEINIHNSPFMLSNKKKIYYFNTTWNLLLDDDLYELIKFIESILMKQFTKWQTDNIEKINLSEEFRHDFVLKLRKTLGENFTKNNKIQKIKNSLIKILKNCNLVFN